MPRFCVTLTETISYEVIVDADDEDAAGKAAEHAFVQAESDTEFACTVLDREVSNVEDITHQQDDEEEQDDGEHDEDRRAYDEDRADHIHEMRREREAGL